MPTKRFGGNPRFENPGYELTLLDLQAITRDLYLALLCGTTSGTK